MKLNNIVSRMFGLWRAALVGLLFFGIADLSAQSNVGNVHYPGKSWEVVDNPETLGFSKEKLEEVGKLASTFHTAAIMVIVDGKVLYQWGDVDQKINTHSVRKSFMSTLYGKYIKDGTIDIDATMADLNIDDVEGLTKEEKKATVRDCLKARSGIYHPALYETKGMRKRKPARHSHKAGTFWYYNNWDFNVLETIFAQETKKDFFEALYEDIAKPIGMEDFVPSDGRYVTGDASEHRAYPFKITARDLARFGWLMLNNGKWNGQQVVDSNWVHQITRYSSDATLYGRPGYGYLWWVARGDNPRVPHMPKVTVPEGTYSAQGARGQRLMVIPEWNMVFVHRVDSSIKGNTISATNMGRLFKLVLDAKIEPYKVINNNL
ncbi:serine hydrolase domain-containing protein [Sinomicrobium sp.]